MGEVLQRFERMGLENHRLENADPRRQYTLAGRHYTYEDIAVRHGEPVRNALITFITSGPVVAFAVEGISAVENVRQALRRLPPSP